MMINKRRVLFFATGVVSLFPLLTGCTTDSQNAIQIPASNSVQQTNEIQEKEVLNDKNISKTTGLETINAMATFVGYANVDELDNDADLILIGTPTQDFIDRTSNNTYYSDGEIQDISTLTDFKIERVIKNKEDVDLGEEIQIIEPISIIEQEGKQVVLTVEDYMELQKGKNYIIFLGKNTFGKYSIINMNNGRFAIEEGNNLERSMMEDSTQERHNEFQKEVLEKYQLNP